MSEISNSVPTGIDSTLVIDRAVGTVAELRRLLAIEPDERTSDWQSTVGGVVGLICTDFAKQENCDVALIEITLISLAAQKGSKDAKKRALKPTRWASLASPSISEIFTELEEAKSAIRVLQPINADWIEGYISREIALNKWPALSLPLVEWLLKTTPTIEAFVRALKREIVQFSGNDTAWITQAIENATKLIVKSPVYAGVGMMSEIAELISDLDSLSQPVSGCKIANEAQSARHAILSFVNQVSNIEPSVLVQGAAPATLNRISQITESKKSAPGNDAEHLCRRTINLLAMLLPNADKALLTHYRNIWSSCRNISSIADQLIKNVARDYPALNLIITPYNDKLTLEDLGVTAGLESVLCELMVNWDDFFALHREDPAADQLAARIDELGLQLGVVRFGHVGEETPFDPIRHYLTDSSSSPPSKVIILKPGILIARSNGSSRVLLMAAVSPSKT